MSEKNFDPRGASGGSGGQGWLVDPASDGLILFCGAGGGSVGYTPRPPRPNWLLAYSIICTIVGAVVGWIGASVAQCL
jgi:hypothetical protein